MLDILLDNQRMDKGKICLKGVKNGHGRNYF